MFILRAKRNKQGKVLRQGMTVLFFTVGEEFLDQEQLHPKNLKKNTRQGGSRALAVTVLR